MTRSQAIAFLRDNPAGFARMLGFTRLGDLHNRWIREMVCGREDHTLQGSRQTYKSTCVSVALALIVILLPNIRTMFMRKTDGDVKEIVKQVSKILQDEHTQVFVNAIYGVDLKLTVNTAMEISTNLTKDVRGTPQLIGIGIGGSLTGKHFDRIFTDDIVNVQDRISKAERERTKLVYQELQNIKNRGGKIFNTGTPWHKEDAFELMPTPERYDCYHPEIQKIIPPEVLADIRAKMTPSLFAANYELQHIATENALFTTPPVFVNDEMAKEILHRNDAKAADLLRDGVAHIDAAYGGEDYTAFTCAKRIGDKIIMYGRMWPAHVDTVLDACVAEAQRMMCAPILCENNGDKGFLAKEIQKAGYRPGSYHERENKYLKISSFLRKWWPSILWLEDTDMGYLAQIMDYSETAGHDDAPDSASVLCRYFDRRSGESYQSVIFGGGIGEDLSGFRASYEQNGVRQGGYTGIQKRGYVQSSVRGG